MTFIDVIPPQLAKGRLEKIYKRVQTSDGQVDNVLQAHSLRPHFLEGHMAVYKSMQQTLMRCVRRALMMVKYLK